MRVINIILTTTEFKGKNDYEVLNKKINELMTMYDVDNSINYGHNNILLVLL